jgi:hypothetical protein
MIVASSAAPMLLVFGTTIRTAPVTSRMAMAAVQGVERAPGAYVTAA